ncbi:hypothetical protein C8F04DRAFT_474626 [Mycena alexandri]|uniref:Secreted protein n=1 Tax=Mycena alexandri TaxID=1745969 RepID=A0AAD6T005_9AGAR|nr:hypothetical protein C8F04DRAFT_474626 [Mycena alexandri]
MSRSWTWCGLPLSALSASALPWAFSAQGLLIPTWAVCAKTRFAQPDVEVLSGRSAFKALSRWSPSEHCNPAFRCDAAR